MLGLSYDNEYLYTNGYIYGNDGFTYEDFDDYIHDYTNGYIDDNIHGHMNSGYIYGDIDVGNLNWNELNGYDLDWYAI